MKQREHINELTDHLFRENSGKMVAVLSRMFGWNDIDLIMDIVQDTFEAALTKWRFSGVPENPSGWLMLVAKNKAINAAKRSAKTISFAPSDFPEHFETRIEERVEIMFSPNEVRDAQLRLLLTCCHPAFSDRNQVILTLYVLCGFGVPEIANALLMKEEAVKKALTRCKSWLKENRPGLEPHSLKPTDERVETARTIIYLMFNEGYKTTRAKEGINNDLCYEAIRLGKLLAEQPGGGSGSTLALLALMSFTLSRFPQRVNLEGEWLSLEEQDRKKWSRVFIEEGYRYLNEATRGNELSRYHLEAMISSLHCSAPVFEATNWDKIAYLYRQLEIVEPRSPFITLNRIVAESYISTGNSISALAEMEKEYGMENSFLFPAARADIYKRNGEWAKAKKAYEAALGLAKSPADKRFLKKKITEMSNH